MPWARTDDGFDAKHEVRETSDAALGLLWKSVTYCARNLTDGVVHSTFVRDHVRGRGPKRCALELVQHNWWVEHDDGFRIVGYLDPDSPVCQPSRHEVVRARDKERQRKAEQRARGKQAVLPWSDPDAPSQGDSQQQRTGQRDSRVQEPPTPPTPNQVSPPDPPASGGAAEWASVCSEIQRELTEFTFGTWIAPMEAVSFADGRLVVRAPEHQRTWIEERYLPLLERAAGRALGPGVVVEIERPEPVRSPRRKRTAA